MADRLDVVAAMAIRAHGRFVDARSTHAGVYTVDFLMGLLGMAIGAALAVINLQIAVAFCRWRAMGIARDVGVAVLAAKP